MHLIALLKEYAQTPSTTVPDWMIGCFKRHCITFANGLSDMHTRVFWLQGRNLTIDLRLPLIEDQVRQPFHDCQPTQLQQLANYEGWSADSHWQDDQLSWSGGTSFQLHNRWPEPAILHRVGNCMMEFAPSGAYVEDWRFQENQNGPLISLRLLEERDLHSGELRHLDGALIITGNWAGLVLGRAKHSFELAPDQQLRDLVKDYADQSHALDALFNFETSIAHGSLEQGFVIRHSNRFERTDEQLCPMDGFEFDATNNQIIQTLTSGNTQIQRRFTIDTLEPEFRFCHDSPWTGKAADWFNHEKVTLGRYLKQIN